MKVPFLNMKKEAEFLLKRGLLDDIGEVISSGHYLFGPKSLELENKLSEITNSYVSLVGSGTDALYLLLKIFGIGPNKKVAIPTISAIPTAVAVKMTGAEIVYIDVLENGTMDYKKLKECGEELSAIIVVHIYGNTAYIDNFVSFCNNKNIPLIEDCAQSFGSRIRGKFTGTFGSAGALSFYPTKNLGCFGDSGGIITKSKNIAEEIKELRFYGQRNKYCMGQKVGMNSRIDEIQSTILLKKLNYIKEVENIKKTMLEKYNNELSGLNNFKTLYWLNGSIPHLYPIFVNNRNCFIKIKINSIHLWIYLKHKKILYLSP